jgi:hypothetical protein
VTRRVIVCDLTTGPDRLTYHVECVGPAYLSGEPFEYDVEVGDTALDDYPAADDACAFCGGPVREPPVTEVIL